MITSLKLNNFKSLESFELTDIKPIVLLSGGNNSGKTTILESLFLFFDHRSPDSFVKLSNFRGVSKPVTNVLWESLFFNMNVNNPISISVIDDEVETSLSYSVDKNYVPSDASLHPDVLNKFVSAAKTSYSLKYSLAQDDYEEIGHFTLSGAGILGNYSVKDGQTLKEMNHALFINNMIVTNDVSINDWFGQIELSGDKDRIIDILKIIEPKIVDVSSISIGGQPTLYANISGKMLPLKLCGDGINRLLYIVSSIMENPSSVIFIDELETGFHYSLYSKIWEIIARVAKENNCQIFVSTHSIECIYGAIKGMENAKATSDFVYYRLDRNGHTVANRFSYELLLDAINANMEVR